MNSLRMFLATLALCGATQAQPRLDLLKFLPGGWSDAAEATAIAPDGAIWIAGSSNAKFDAPGPNVPYQKENKGKSDVFIVKYYLNNSGGATIDFFTWLGGDGDDEARSIAIDASGKVHVTGITRSSNFPTTSAALATTLKGTQDAFYSVIDPTQGYDQALYYSTYYGTDGVDEATAMALDAEGRAVIVGHTDGDDLPGISGNAQPARRGGVEAFVVRFNPNAEPHLTYATYYGGNEIDIATGVGVAPGGQIWFTGYTSSTDFPVTGQPAYQSFLRSAYDGFLVQLDLTRPGLDALQYSTYFGGNSSDIPTGLKINPQDGTVWIVGHTSSSDLETKGNSAQVGFGGGSDAFIAQFFNTGQTWWLGYSTYIGGPGYEVAYGLTILPDGRVSLGGYQLSGGLPTTANAIQSSPSSAFTDAFITTVNPHVAGFEGITFSSYLGGEFNDVITSMNSDSSGALIITGYSYSFGLPVTDGSGKTSPAGLSSGFLTKISQ